MRPGTAPERSAGATSGRFGWAAAGAVLLLLAGCGHAGPDGLPVAEPRAGVLCGTETCLGERPVCCADGETTTCRAAGDCPAHLARACDGFEDCGEGSHCVVSALGSLGCQPGSGCCGAQECYDGCHADSECPPCRPACRDAGPDRAGRCFETPAP
ncbi:MAG: hypothetical protein HY905_24165 [Deltaproteobacteria bacterium]|nr:hypothetical protein [Deltaproteobacteria bacterium]